jgi:hypothetical protein
LFQRQSRRNSLKGKGTAVAHIRKNRSRADFQRRYNAYARDHDMTPERILSYDRQCCPDALLKPYLLWLSDKGLAWDTLRSGPAGSFTEVDFDQWLDSLSPGLDALTCECHRKLAPGWRKNDSRRRT